jgi:hypothetical protein
VHSVSIGEWVVARVSNKKQATSIVGDLLELEPQKGPLWFWLSLAGVVVSLAWRRSLAFVAAVCAYFVAFGGSFLMSWLRIPLHSIPDGAWRIVFAVFFLAANFLWFLLVYAAIRYGVRDSVTRIALAFALLISAGVYSWSRPAVLATSVVFAICLVAASLWSVQRRRAALVVLAVLMAGYATFLLTGSLIALYEHFLRPGPFGDSELQRHPVALWFAFSMFFLMTPWIMSAACSRMRNRLMRNPSFDSESHP